MKGGGSIVREYELMNKDIEKRVKLPKQEKLNSFFFLVVLTVLTEMS